MTGSDGSLWQTIGRTVEAASAFFPDPPRPERQPAEDPEAMAEGDSSGSLVLGAITALVTTGIVRWARRHRPPTRRLARGAAAGAAAAGIVLAGRALLSNSGPREDEKPTRAVPNEILAGAGRGILYAAFLDPLLPGHPWMKGALVGCAEHFAAPLGGLYLALEPVSPLRRVPLLSALLEIGSDPSEPLLAHLCNGALLALLCGPAPRVTHLSEEES